MGGWVWLLITAPQEDSEKQESLFNMIKEAGWEEQIRSNGNLL